MDRIKWLKEEIAEKRKELKALNDKLAEEKRARTDEEKTTSVELRDAIKDMEDELHEREEDEKRAIDEAKKNKNDKPTEQRAAAMAAAGGGDSDDPDSEDKDLLKMSRDFSFAKAVRSFMGLNPLDGVEKELHDEAIKERNEGGGSYGYSGVGIPGSILRAEWEAAERRSKGIEYRTDIDQSTSAIQPTVVGRYVEAIRQNAVFSQVIPGSNILTGLTADFKIPTVGSQSLAWATAENSSAADGGANFGKDTLAPIRLTGFANISDKVIMQNGEVALNVVMADFGRETANKIDAALFSTTNITNAIPAIAATTGVKTFTEAATYAAPSNTVNGTVYDDFLAALQTLANADTAKGALAFVGHTKLMSDLIKSPQVIGVSPGVTMFQTGAPLMINMNGIRFFLTTSNTSNGTTSADFIGGDFNHEYLGFFGGLDISVDPWAKKREAMKQIVVHRWMDASAIRGAAFVKSTTLLS